MSTPKNAMEIFKLLEKSNCRECGEKTCLAFAGAVFRGQKPLADCPRLDEAVVERFGGDPAQPNPLEENREAFLQALKQQISEIDLSAAAEKTGGRFKNNRLTLKILGKDFSVDQEGTLYTDIHVNPWVAAPFFDYVINGQGVPPTGQWVSFRELKNGPDRYPCFGNAVKRPCSKSPTSIPTCSTMWFTFSPPDRWSGSFNPTCRWSFIPAQSAGHDLLLAPR